MLFSVKRVQLWAENLFLGWWVLAASVAIQVLSAGFLMQAYSTYVAVMQLEFTWSKTAFASAFALQQATSGFLGPAQGWALQRFGPRAVIRTGITVFAVGLMLFSQVDSLLSFYAVILVLAVGAGLSGFLSLNTVAVQWFEKRRSLALALMQTGISMGGLIVPLIALALTTYGWRATVFGLGVIVLLVGWPLSYLIHNRPEDYNLLPDGASREEQKAHGLKGMPEFTAKQALKTRAFWFLGVGHGIALAVVFGVVAHIAVQLTEEIGLSLQLASVIIALITTMSIIGQLFGGFLGDRLNKRLIATGAMFGHATALLMLVVGATLPWVIAFAVIHGLSWGMRGPIMQSLRADYFGRRAFAQIMGYSVVIVTLGMMGGPIILGALADLTGSYRTGFASLAGLAVLGSFFFYLATPPVNPESRG